MELHTDSQSTSPTADNDLAYWTKQLTGTLPRLDLPVDRQPRPRNGFVRNTRQFEIDSTTGEELRRLAARKGADLSTALLATFQVLLFRYTGQTDLIVGISFPQAPADPLLVYEAGNTVLLRTRISDDTTFAEFLAQVQSMVRETQPHAGIALGKLADVLGIRGTQQPLVQAMFGFRQDALFVREPTDESECSELNLWFEHDADGLHGKADFDADLFDGETIERLIGHFQRLLEGILANPEQKVSRLPLLGELERQKVLYEWNQTAMPYASDKTITELFEEQVQREPDKVAVVFGDEELTYRQLNARADTLAGRLQRRGVGPDVRVAVCLLRSIDMVVALYAIHKAGGAYVPLDPSYPTERIAFMLEDAQARLVLTQRCLSETLPSGQANVLFVDAPGDVELPEQGGDPVSGCTPENLAYVIYTSGSTGKPKGVMVRHRNVVNLFTGLDNTIGRDSGTWLAVTSISFDISVLELFWTLTRGFKVVIHGDDASWVRKFAAVTREGNRSMAEEIRRHQVTHLQCTPSLAGMMLDDNETREALCQVKTLLFGGEPMPRSLAGRIYWGARIFNLYGPTETTVWSSVSSVKRNDRRISIGRPIANTRMYILDRYLQPLPARVAGELYIAGEGVAGGYLNRPELTEQRFIREPFVEDVEARMYRTGDVARFNADGTIDFLGRVDNQVKVRGHRIELGEIESVLRQQSGIRECVVSVWEAASNDTRLVGYYVPQSGADPQPDELRNAIKNKLPDYMVPALFHRLQTLPLTPNGKVDRKALANPQAAGGAKNGDGKPGLVAPAVKVQASGSKGGVVAKLPLTEAQHEIWIGAQMSDELSCSFNQSVQIQVRGRLDEPKLFASVEWLVKRHEALRAAFASSGEEQWLHSEMPVELGCVDLTTVPAEFRQAELDHLLKKEAGMPFDLSGGPLFRFRLARIAPEETVLLVTLHHIVCDGCSLGILLSEWGEHYSALVTGARVPAPLEKTYSQFIREQLARGQGRERTESEAFWMKQCSLPLPALPLPVDRILSAPRKYAGAGCELLLSASASQAIKKLSVARRCSITGTLLAGYFLLLQDLSEQSDIIIGLPMTVREGLGSDCVVGHCVNFLPLRLQFRDDPAFTDHLDRVWKLMIKAIEHQQITLSSLLQKLNGPPHQPMISVMFNMDSANERMNFAGCSADVKCNPFGYSRFDLSLSASEVQDRLAIRCEYSAELFESETINGWLNHYERLLSEAAANPARRLSQLPKLVSANRPVKTNLTPPVATARSAAGISAARPPVEEPATETERKLAAIWREVLLVDQVGRHESFFDVGGHSLLATKITARVAKAFGINLPVRAIFESSTIARLAAVVDETQRTPTAAAPPSIGRRVRGSQALKLLDRLAHLSDTDLKNLLRNTDSQK